jgi:hypothetical protein
MGEWKNSEEKFSVNILGCCRELVLPNDKEYQHRQNNAESMSNGYVS